MKDRVEPLRVLLVGRGRMGRLVESLASSHGVVVKGMLGHDREANAAALERLEGIDVAIDFSTAEAVPENFPRLAVARCDVVIGTTGWQAYTDLLRRIAADAGIGVVAAPNFSIGASLFAAIVSRAAELASEQEEYGAWIHERHHAAKKDAPSGTALALERTMRDAGLTRAIDVSSSRVGSVPGLHEVGFDGRFDTITLTHNVRDRRTFAAGALEAARWVHGRQGWFSMRDMLMTRANAAQGANQR
jgi:4-hydroxy-tetrahydrodipicolinate reductase